MVYPKVEVHWIDATHYGGWTPWEDIVDLKPKKCITMGFQLPHSDKKSIRVAQTLSEDHVGDLLIIPKGWIKKVIKR